MMGNELETGNSLRYLEQVDRDLVTRQQLAEHRKTVPAAIFANLVNAAIVLILFAWKVPPVLLGLWCGIFACAMTARLLLQRNNRAIVKSSQKMLQLKRRITVNAAIFAHLWGIAVASLLSLADAAGLMVLAVVGAGKMNTGVITYRHLPEAARAWTVIISASIAIGLIFLGGLESYLVLGLLSMFAMVLMISSKSNFADFVSQILVRRDISESADTVKLLLNDFEEQSPNWLFSVDRQGFLVDIPDRFVEAAERTRTELQSLPLADLVKNKEKRLELIENIARGRSFRDLVIDVQVGEEIRWWMISGKAKESLSQQQEVTMRGVISDITAQKKAEEKVSYMAHFDGLTDLPNRRLFSETLNRSIHRATAKDDIALLMFDLDHFKAINDTLGHPVGDKFLKTISRKLEELVTPGDLLARIGGDEFALILLGERARQAADIAQQIIAEVGQPQLVDDHNVVSSASLGLAHWHPEIEDPDLLVKYADLALYSAKGAGRNRVAIFEKGMDIAAEERRNLELDLRASLGRDEMRLQYQPLVDLKSQKKIGYEALLRWEHPERGVVMPDEFIPVAEETGMIVQLGEWIIRQALQDAASWSEQLTVAVNLSPSQMRSAGLVPTVVNALAKSGVDPARLELEITESILMHDSKANIETLHSLRDLGVRISLDDFGTGYSSLNYLRSFPFDKIKIDRCFVSEIDTREDCRAIIRSVISLAQNLGMTTTAEGVEREGQAQELRLEGCDQVQGFLYGKAESIKDCTDLRSNDRWIPNVESIFVPGEEPEVAADSLRKTG